jgi:hypothetical protein
MISFIILIVIEFDWIMFDIKYCVGSLFEYGKEGE